MKRTILIVLAIVLLPMAALAAPFLVCDPQTGVDHYVSTGPPWVPTSVIAQADGSLKMDVSASTVGTNSLTVKACKNDAVWGELCSIAAPFVFTRPTSPTAPANTQLTP